MLRSWIQTGFCLASCWLLPLHAQAQIVPDTTLPVNSIVAPGCTVCTIDGGTVRGVNLFHSFNRFSVPTGGEAFFNNAASIQNIFTRVTGRLRSEIDGTLRTNGTANLFLLNPNGILFGSNARLLVGGSFVATTANSFRFPDGSEFSATNPQAPPLLTVNVTPGLQFGNNPEPIRVLGANLQIPSNRALALVGGNIEIDGGILQAPGARVELGGLSAVGMVTLNDGGNNYRLTFPVGAPRADVTLRNRSLVDVSAGGGGEIAINARNIELLSASRLQGGIATSLGTSNSQAGDININAASLLLAEDSSVKNDLLGKGRAGSIIIRISGPISLLRGTPGNTVDSGTSISSTVGNYSAIGLQPNVEGQGGDIDIIAGSLSMNDRSFISTSTYAKGDAGNISIQTTGSISLIGRGIVAGGVTAPIITSLVANGAEGNGGDIDIRAGSLLVDEGLISSATVGAGNAGNILIKADTLVVLTGSSYISTSFEGTVNGTGGNIDIRTSSLSISNDAYLVSKTSGNGNSGHISITASDSINLSGSNVFESFVIGTNVEQGAVGNGGDIRIATGTLNLSNRAVLETGSAGQGNAGNVIIQARGLVSLDGQSLIRSNVGTPLRRTTGGRIILGSTATGNVGTIIIDAENIFLTNGGQLQAGFYPRTSGEAGKIVLRASDSVIISGVSTVGTPSGIFTDVEPLSEGNGGEISILARTFFLGDGAVIRANTAARRNAGNIQITATNSANISNGAAISSATSARGNAGNIQITGADSINISGSNLRTGVPTYVGAFTLSSGSAGNITFNTRAFRLFNGAVVDSTNTAPNRLRSGETNSSSGNSGSILINARTVDLINGGNLSVAADGSGQAGSITINARKRVTIEGFDPTFEYRSQLAPDWTRNFYNPNSTILVRSRGLGGTGNVTINSPEVRMNQGTISAESATVDGGNIFLNVRDLLFMRGGSVISATAGTAQAGGNGGSIFITAPEGFLVAPPNDNNDIFANAFRGSGGQVIVNAQGIYYFTPRSRTELLELLREPPLTPRRLPSNDITAISQENPSLSGTVTIQTPNIDPSSGLVELPTLVDASNQIDQRCRPENQQGSTFTVTGRGGLPSNPTDPLRSQTALTQLVPLPESDITATSSTAQPPLATPVNEIIIARSWVREPNGDIRLVAEATDGAIPAPPLALPGCNQLQFAGE